MPSLPVAERSYSSSGTMAVMVEWAGIDWGDDVAPFHKTDELDGDGCEFYTVFSAVASGKNEWVRPYRLLYVGLAYHQSVQKRIRQDHQAYDQVCAYLSEHRRDRDVLVMLGHLRVYSPERVTREFVGDVESLLIFENQPRFNKRNKNTYEGRPLVVASLGEYEPLKRMAKSSLAALSKWKREGGEADLAAGLEDDE